MPSKTNPRTEKLKKKTAPKKNASIYVREIILHPPKTTCQKYLNHKCWIPCCKHFVEIFYLNQYGNQWRQIVRSQRPVKICGGAVVLRCHIFKTHVCCFICLRIYWFKHFFNFDFFFHRSDKFLTLDRAGPNQLILNDLGTQLRIWAPHIYVDCCLWHIRGNFICND